MKKWVKSVVCALSLSAVHVFASESYLPLQQGWEKAKYELEGKAQMGAYEALLKQAKEAKAANPQEASVKTWSGIINASYAGAKGGLGALKFAKAAKADLESAIALDDKALDGAAYNTLGTLLYRVPGWPVGFGDKKAAESMLKKSLSINPTGIDANYFYGEFLRDKGELKEALAYYEKALAAPARPDRPLADAGRKKEVEQAIAEVKAKL